MNQNLYQALKSMQAYLYKQDKKIYKLQQHIETLEKKVTELQNRPPVTVERLEYKFDQLKVETLEGTLNIGLNPTDLNSIDDLSVNSQTPSGVIVNKNPLLKKNLLNRLNQFINQDLESVIRDTEKQLNVNLEPKYVHL